MQEELFFSAAERITLSYTLHIFLATAHFFRSLATMNRTAAMQMAVPIRMWAFTGSANTSTSTRMPAVKHVNVRLSVLKFIIVFPNVAAFVILWML